jgi:hypothetical protein
MFHSIVDGIRNCFLLSPFLHLYGFQIFLKNLNLRNKYMSDKIPAVGSKLLVFRGLAKHTSGGLTKKDLMRHKGRIVSKKQHKAGLKAIKHLHRLGYKPKKGTFKLMCKSMVDGRKRKAKHTRKRGGAAGLVGFADMPPHASK